VTPDVGTINEPLVEFANRTGRDGAHFIAFRLEGTASNRDAVGARLAIWAGGRRRVAARLGGGSYQSAGDGRIHFGLGPSDRVDSVEILWSSGQVDRHRDVAADRIYALVWASLL
jgi:hypothetical protein